MISVAQGAQRPPASPEQRKTEWHAEGMSSYTKMLTSSQEHNRPSYREVLSLRLTGKIRKEWPGDNGLEGTS